MGWPFYFRGNPNINVLLTLIINSVGGLTGGTKFLLINLSSCVAGKLIHDPQYRTSFTPQCPA